MAQQVERFTRNEQVGGSNPPTSSKRPKRDKRSGLFRFLISSPALPFFLVYSAHNRSFIKNVQDSVQDSVQDNVQDNVQDVD